MNRASTSTHQESDLLQEERDDRQPDPASGCLLRVYWMFLGNVFLCAMAYQIVQAEGRLTTVDVVYWLGAASLIAVRYVDIHHLHGRTTEGQPATPGDWRRYCLGVLAVSAVLWIVVHGLGYVV
jgi:hypothetical protein